MGRSLVTDAKAIKNSVELEGMRQCHLRDAAALCHYFAWLEDQLAQGKQLSEVEAADKLEGLRRQQKDFVGLSFETISSTGSNGAIIHYKPEPETCKIIDPKLIYLCDSGGQYKDGTTDVTRTYHFGQPNDYEKRCFTRVLQGHIAIDRCVFPLGTTGYLLDPFARQALWRDGLDFRHGTGHGVGAFLNVHEGPHGIGTRASYNESPFAEGMTITNGA
jgi:Xaa-Pro aminopeptidase